jgi:hypothetical protein
LEYSGKNINSIGKSLAFGEVLLSKTERKIYKTLSSNFISLCRTLPDYTQNQAMFFLLDYYHIKVGEPVDFIKYYYKPIWTIIPRMMESGTCIRELTGTECETAMLGQAMSLFLHSLDDHLNDGNISPSHLLLLLRSQAWLLFNKAIDKFTDRKDEYDIAHFLINDYYGGISTVAEPSGLDEYCNRFKKEMSTVNVMPVLSAKKITGRADFADEIKKAIESFGIAWRILDDIQDAEEDIAEGRHTALYYSLPRNAKNLWDAARNNAGENSKTGIGEEIYRELERGRIAEILIQRIIRELDEARKTVEALEMHGMAEQYRAIGAPIEKWLKER